ncbi:MAG: sugar transferase [Synergistaceae bacterium]|nr:sugar transferase [Synergistaceae bacterium]
MAAFKFLLSVIQLILDALLFNLCLSVFGIEASFETRAFITGTVTAFYIFSSMYGFGNWTFWDETKQCMRSLLYAFLVSILFLYARKNTIPFFGIIFAFGAFVPLCLAVRYVFRRVLFGLGLLSTSVIILGAGSAGEIFAENIISSPFIARKVLGFLDDDENKQGMTISGVPVLGRLSDFERVQGELHADEAIIAIPTASRRELSGILGRVEELAGRVLYVPDMYMLTTMSAEMRSIDGMPVISASQGLLNPVNRFVKSIIDYVGGFVALCLSSPFMAYAAWKVKREDGGKIFFLHERIGKDLKPFKLFKFRTMVENAEEILREMMKDDNLRREFEEAFKFKDDKRITKIGHMLRRTSLDELPQLFNVLRGEMSLTGPRPIVQKEIELYYGYRTARQIFRVKPGMTGFWQVSGRNDVKDYQQRIDFDLYYIHNWSVWLDIIIMIRTVKAVFKGSGAY